MDDREQKIRTWFGMWLQGSDTGAEELFDPDAVYIESWGPEYHGLPKIRRWFREWNTRGRVLQWEIRQFFHKGDQTAAEWYFRCQMDDGQADAFDGMSLVRWTAGGGRSAFCRNSAAMRTGTIPMKTAPCLNSGSKRPFGSDIRCLWGGILRDGHGILFPKEGAKWIRPRWAGLSRRCGKNRG